MRRVHIPWVQGLIRASVFGVLGFRAFGCEGLVFFLGGWIPKFKMLEAYGWVLACRENPNHHRKGCLGNSIGGFYSDFTQEITEQYCKESPICCSSTCSDLQL